MGKELEAVRQGDRNAEVDESKTNSTFKLGIEKNIYLPPDENKGALIHPAPDIDPDSGKLIHPEPEADLTNGVLIHPIPDVDPSSGVLIHPLPEADPTKGVLIHPAPDKDEIGPQVYFSESGETEKDKIRKPKPDCPEEVLEALKHELLGMNLVENGEIPKERGQEAADLIRERLRPYIEDPNGRNIAFFIFESNGVQDVSIGISGETGPGAKITENKLVGGKKADAENKALNELLGKLIESQSRSGSKDAWIAGYTEQAPCLSCNAILNVVVPSKLKELGIECKLGDTSWTFQNRSEREKHNRKRGSKANQ